MKDCFNFTGTQNTQNELTQIVIETERIQRTTTKRITVNDDANDIDYFEAQDEIISNVTNTFLNQISNLPVDQIGRKSFYEDNIQKMYKDSSHTSFFDLLNEPGIDKSLSDFTVKSLKIFAESTSMTNLRFDLFKCADDELLREIDQCPTVLAVNHRDVIYVFHTCKYKTAECSCNVFKKFSLANFTIATNEIESVLGNNCSCIFIIEK